MNLKKYIYFKKTSSLITKIPTAKRDINAIGLVN
jgi:hypothetical protein